MGIIIPPDFHIFPEGLKAPTRQDLGASVWFIGSQPGDYPPIQEEDERHQLHPAVVLSATGWFMIRDPEATVGGSIALSPEKLEVVNPWKPKNKPSY